MPAISTTRCKVNSPQRPRVPEPFSACMRVAVLTERFVVSRWSSLSVRMSDSSLVVTSPYAPSRLRSISPTAACNFSSCSRTGPTMSAIACSLRSIEPFASAFSRAITPLASSASLAELLSRTSAPTERNVSTRDAFEVSNDVRSRSKDSRSALSRSASPACSVRAAKSCVCNSVLVSVACISELRAWTSSPSRATICAFMPSIFVRKKNQVTTPVSSATMTTVTNDEVGSMTYP